MTVTPALAQQNETAESDKRVVYTLRVVIALVLSLFVHSSVMVFGFLLRGGSPSQGGEAGNMGAGDLTVDVSVAGPAATIAPPAQSADPTPPTPPAKPTVTPPTPSASAELEQPPPVPTPRHEDETVKPQPTSTPNQQSAGGTDSDKTSGGRAPGVEFPFAALGGAPNTVQGQRAMLPAAMVCKDPVAGRWEAVKYNPMWGDWVRFTLAVHNSGSALSGTITSRTWSGGPLDSKPPVCGPGHFDITVAMNAHGRAGATKIEFGASSYTVTAVTCPSSTLDYSPDNFSGTIDPARQEFQSVNNDGARDIDQPYVFRRTGCLDE
jgi:hypothetical protein